MLHGSVLITGGSGTLGNAIVQWAQDHHRSCSFTIYSRSELRQAEMKQKYPHLRYVIGDIRDAAQLSAAVAGHDTVIHAAAMKRIPECEVNPTECLQTNVIGSMNVVRACINGGVRKCIGISTDKACAAITMYGATKRVMEGIFQRSSTYNTHFMVVRYGNVVASNGSVVPLWQQQAAEGHPLTLTGARMTRFWMSKWDAVQLIDYATMADAGTITIPKIGALSIREMASIVAPGAETMEMGLRSCEKQHEDLIHPDEAAIDYGLKYFVIKPEGQAGGISYTSETARTLLAAEFLNMLEVA